MLKELNKDLVKEINKKLDPTLIRKNYGGEKYVTGYTVVRLLNKATNGAWDFNVDKVWTEEAEEKGKKKKIYFMNVTLNLYFDDGKGNQMVLHKPGTAGKILENGSKNATNIYKSLLTLCLRKAASYAGVGAELWLNDEEVDYFEAEDVEPIWTQELMEKYEKQWTEIGQIAEDCGVSDEDMDGIVNTWKPECEGLDMIQPEDIDAFLAFLKSEIEKGSEEEANA